MKTSYLSVLVIAVILAAATWTARLYSLPAGAAAQPPKRDKLTAPSAIAHAEAPARSPIEAARAIHAARATTNSAEAIEDMIVESHRTAITRLLTAVDGVLAADESLHKRVLNKYGVSLPESWNLGVMRDNLGLFSTNVTFISETVSGNTAVVTIQEGDHVPLVHARFVNLDGNWLHEPDPVSPAVSDALDRLAETIRDVERSVDEGAPFNSLADAFTFRILPRMSDVARAGAGHAAD